jgi:hypothetical protein
MQLAESKNRGDESDTLRREILSRFTAAQQEIARLKGLMFDTELARVRLVAERDALAQDAARLDWLERDHNATVYPTLQHGDFGVLVMSEHGRGFSPNGKVREAIDAALSPTGDPK